MITSKIRELAAAKETVARLEAEIEAELQSKLSSLHEDYGFVDVESFIVAVNEAADGSTMRRKRKVKTARKSRTRAKITDAIRARVKKLIKAGKSGASIAKAVGISLPSVQNIKKAFGLVKSRVQKKKPKKRRGRKTAAKKAPTAAQAAAPAAEKSESTAT